MKKQLPRKIEPQISVCIPVFDTERYLSGCLRSVMLQDFDFFEIVVVSDNSRGRDEKGRNAKKIVKLCQKLFNRERKERGLLTVPVRFIEHRENRGLIEVRRTLCLEACGKFMTQVDSDDQMEEGALKTLYEVATKNGMDIVHGTSTAGVFDEDGTFIPAKENRYGTIYYGQLEGKDVFHKWLVDGDFTANTWGKLIKRDLWMKAYDNIPYTECNMADDLLLFFFLAQYASSYVGIKDKVYRYRVNTGMSSRRKIDSLHKWKMICSTASVFTVLSTWISENPDVLQPDELENIRKRTSYYL